MSWAQQTPMDRSKRPARKKGPPHRLERLRTRRAVVLVVPASRAPSPSPEHDLTSGHAPRPIRPSRLGNQKPLGLARRLAAISLTLSWVRGGRPDQYCVLPAASLLGRRPQALACRSGVKQYSMEYRKAKRFGGLEVSRPSRILSETAPGDRPASRRAECDRHKWRHDERGLPGRFRRRQTAVSGIGR